MMELFNDLLFSILEFSDVKTLNVCSLVCKKWYTLIQCGNQSLWKQLLINSVRYRQFTDAKLMASSSASDDSNEVIKAYCSKKDPDFVEYLQRVNSLLEKLSKCSLEWKTEYRKFCHSIKCHKFWSTDFESSLIDAQCMTLSAPPEKPLNSTFLVKCYIKAEKKGHYKLYHEDSNTLLLTAQLLNNSYMFPKEYTILAHDSSQIGYLSTSRFGLQFDLKDLSLCPVTLRVNYRANIFGFGGYNKLCVTLLDDELDKEEKDFTIQYIKKLIKQNCSTNSNAEDIKKTITFVNRPPIWNSKHMSWSLDFGGRVKVRSVKNFQLMEPNEKIKSNFLVMGRIDSNTFALDYKYPFNALQAFCVALSALDHKFACP